jgi:hypothetical protein
MPWKQSLATFLTDALRLSIRSCLFIDGILLALFSVWFCFKCLFQIVNWLDRVLFDAPW